jgi:hypothetical protein
VGPDIGETTTTRSRTRPRRIAAFVGECTTPSMDENDAPRVVRVWVRLGKPRPLMPPSAVMPMTDCLDGD